ncbi:MAG: CBS domain-containing protein [Candidatus Bathyarchaeia archaeon]|nr:CBS domain-containing protein [Candidatus Bathyarchaeota archaeon]
MEKFDKIKQMEIEELGEPPLIVPSNLSISKLIGILKEENAYEAFIIKEGKISVVSIREILKSTNINSKVSSIAFFIPKVSSKLSIGEAAKIMNEYRIRTLPVFDGNKLTKAVKASSILELSLKEVWSLPVSKLANLNLTSIQKDSSIMKAKNLMVKKDIDHLPVLDLNKLIGVVNSSQIVFNLFLMESSKRGELMKETLRKSGLPVEGLMEEPFTIAPNEDAFLTLKKMLSQNSDYGIITLWDEPQGIITFRDYMKLFYESKSTFIDLPVYITGLPKDFLNTELIKIKFLKAVKNLVKVYPDLLEAKANVKTLKKGYEVYVNINTSKKLISLTENGWDLTVIFDNISKRLKRVLTQKRSKRKSKL